MYDHHTHSWLTPSSYVEADGLPSCVVARGWAEDEAAPSVQLPPRTAHPLNPVPQEIPWVGKELEVSVDPDAEFDAFDFAVASF